MKKTPSTATIANILVLAFAVLINPLCPLTPYRPSTHPCIPDKVEIRYTRPLSPDSTLQLIRQAKEQLNEMNYYFKVHNVTDEGYNQVARYRDYLQIKVSYLSKIYETPAQQRVKSQTVHIPAKQRPYIAVKLPYGYWRAGHFYLSSLTGKAIACDLQGRVVSAYFRADTVVSAIRIDSEGIYKGQMDTLLQARGQGTYEAKNGEYHEGFWSDNKPHGFGFHSSPSHSIKVGEWKAGRFLGERMKYTAERIYGIDVSRHQHEKGKKRYSIDWHKVRITSLGTRHNAGGQTFPVSFVYIKSTEGTTIRNRYFLSDYMNAKKQGIRVGAYHFFSLKSSATAQANYFVNHTLFRKGDFPPVMDVEPTDGQIKKIGGDDVLMERIRTFMSIVERRTGMRPILYVSQNFIKQHMANASDIKQKYNVWIARYGQYRPDVKLVYWQLSADGRVEGINGPVDINVFNGYQVQYEEFKQMGFYK